MRSPYWSEGGSIFLEGGVMPSEGHSGVFLESDILDGGIIPSRAGMIRLSGGITPSEGGRV